MTINTQTHWTCDRCGHMVSLDPSNAPQDWVSLDIDIDVSRRSTPKQAELCPTCANHVLGLMNINLDKKEDSTSE